MVIDFMELEAYKYAKEKFSIPDRAKPRVSVGELFDMAAGTSTGSLLAACLVVPLQKGSKIPKNYAADALRVYMEEGPNLFKEKQISYLLIITATFIFAVIGFAVGNHIGKQLYQADDHEKTITAFKSYIEKHKQDIESDVSQVIPDNLAITEVSENEFDRLILKKKF